MHVPNLEWWAAVFDANFLHDEYTTKSNAVVVQFVPEDLLQNSPCLQSAIDCLVPSAHCSLLSCGQG